MIPVNVILKLLLFDLSVVNFWISHVHWKRDKFRNILIIENLTWGGEGKGM